MARLDVTKEDDISRVAQEIKSQQNGVDLLVNCAAMLHPSGRGETSLKAVDQKVNAGIVKYRFKDKYIYISGILSCFHSHFLSFFLSVFSSFSASLTLAFSSPLSFNLFDTIRGNFLRLHIYTRTG